MINKFLANKSGGGNGSVNYLLDTKRVQNGTAKILRGEEHITRALIDSIGKKQKTTFAGFNTTLVSVRGRKIRDRQNILCAWLGIYNDFSNRFSLNNLLLKNCHYYTKKCIAGQLKHIFWLEKSDKYRLLFPFGIA